MEIHYIIFFFPNLDYYFLVFFLENWNESLYNIQITRAIGGVGAEE
jgi:hypothetical protein